MPKPIIFISHIHEDAQIATCVKEFIDEAFLGMFEIFASSDGASIRSGDNWSSSIENALRKAEVVLALISPAAANRRWIFFECGGAYFANKRVIPVCCLDMQVSELGTPLSWLQAVNGADQASVERLISDIATAFELRIPKVSASTLSQYLLGQPCKMATSDVLAQTPSAQRSLPIFFVVDTSASMRGRPIDSLTQALKQLMEELLQNTSPEVVPLVSVVSFGSGAKEVVPPSPLTSELMDFKFEPSGTSDLGAALSIVAKRLAIPNWLSANYYRPTVLLITDGQPTDDWRAGLAKLEEAPLGKTATRISVGLGDSTDFNFLSEISGASVVSIPDLQNLQGLSKFFGWLSQSLENSKDSGPITLPEVQSWSNDKA